MEKLNNPEYRRDFEQVCKKLGEKYGPMMNSVLDEIRQEKKNAKFNRAVSEMDNSTQRNK